MNERTLRPANVAAAVMAIGGALTLVFPGHVLSILQVVAVTVAAAAGLYVLAVHVPPSGWISPFRWMSPFRLATRPQRRGGRSAELEAIRVRMSGRRQRIAGGPPLPPAVLRMLQPALRAALDLDLREGVPPPQARDRLSPAAWTVLTAEPLAGARWFRTLHSDPRAVAEAVHVILDELDRLSVSPGDPPPTPASDPVRAT